MFWKKQMHEAEVLLEGGQGDQEGQSPRNLVDQLTLFKPGGQIMPLTLLPDPRI